MKCLEYIRTYIRHVFHRNLGMLQEVPVVTLHFFSKLMKSKLYCTELVLFLINYIHF